MCSPARVGTPGPVYRHLWPPMCYSGRTSQADACDGLFKSREACRRVSPCMAVPAYTSQGGVLATHRTCRLAHLGDAFPGSLRTRTISSSTRHYFYTECSRMNGWMGCAMSVVCLGSFIKARHVLLPSSAISFSSGPSTMASSHSSQLKGFP